MTKSDYERVASQINRTIRHHYKNDLFTVNPHCKVVADGKTDHGYVIQINNDLYEMAQTYGTVAESIFYTDEFVWVVDDNDFGLKEIGPDAFALCDY